VFTGASIFDYAGALELSEVTGNSGLAHAEDFLELSHGQLGLVEEQEKAEAGGVGQQPEQINS
jgi:hypothetical protein